MTAGTDCRWVLLLWFWVMKKLRKNAKTVLDKKKIATSIYEPQRNITHVLVSDLL